MINQLAPNLWTVNLPHRFFGLEFGVRMTIVRLQDGGLWLHSPVSLSSKLKQELDHLEPVKYLVAPNCFHHVFLGDYIQAYPQAELYGVPGLAEKRKDLSFKGTLDSTKNSGWDNDLQQQLIEGIPQFNEVVFYHADSKSLISCDLLLNIPVPQPLWTRWYLKFSGIYGKPGVSKVIKMAVKDRSKMKQSIESLMNWDFDRLILSHGLVIEQDAKLILERSFAWL